MPLVFNLYEAQQYALLSTATEILFGGAASPGKSFLLRAASIILSLEVPGINVYLFRRLYRELMLNHVYSNNGYLSMLDEMIKANDVQWNKSEGVFHFYNGSRIFLCHAQHESDVEIYQGAEFNVLLIDEAGQFTEPMLRFLRGRLRLGGLQPPKQYASILPKIIYASNPGGVSHSYLKSGFVDFGARVKIKAPVEDGGMVREYVPAKFTDNIVQMRNDPTYAERLMGLGDPQKVKAFLEGSWDILVDGPFADDWDASVHVIDPFDIPSNWTIDRSHDHGTSAPAATVYFAECDGTEVQIEPEEKDASGKVVKEAVFFGPPRGSLIIIGEVYFADKQHKGLNLTPTELAQRMVTYEKDEKLSVKPGPADNAIFTAAPGYSSIHSYYQKEGITFSRSDKTPGSRVRGVQFFRQYLKNTRKRVTDKPHIYIFRTAYHTIRTVPNLPRDEKDKDDIDSTSEDHIWDAVRYRILKSAGRAAQTPFQGH